MRIRPPLSSLQTTGQAIKCLTNEMNAVWASKAWVLSRPILSIFSTNSSHTNHLQSSLLPANGVTGTPGPGGSYWNPSEVLMEKEKPQWSFELLTVTN